MGTRTAKEPGGLLATNRKARHDFEILGHLEVGLELRGTEVKSVRAGEANLLGAYARVEAGQLWVYNLNIPIYACGNRFNHEPTRPRRLLAHASEIRRLHTAVEQERQVLVPLSLFLKRGYIKMDLGLCRGKTHEDRRETLKARAETREVQRAMRR